MKKILYIMCALVLSLAARAQVNSGMDSTTRQPIRVLAIGNSFSDDAIVQYLYELANEAGIKMIIGNAYRGGQSLSGHWADVTEQRNTIEYRKIIQGKYTSTPGSALSTIIQDEPWDYISFQQVSQESGQTGTIEPSLTRLMEYTKSLQTNPNAQYGYHMTWAYAKSSTHGGFANYGNSQQAMYDSIVQTVQHVMATHPELTFLAPSGTAIQNARTTYIGDNLDRDGYHLDYQFGRYTAACTWLETITGRSAVGLRFRPEGVDSITARTCQMAAHMAVVRPYAVTNLAGEGYPIINNIRPAGLIKLNFGAVKTADSAWNNITPAYRTYNYITDSQLNPTGITVSCHDSFSGTNNAGATFTTTKMLMPADVSSSAIWGYAAGAFGKQGVQPTGGYTLGHLNPSLKYDFTIFSSRSNCSDFRETSFTLLGDKTYSGDTDAANNAHHTLVIKNVRPSEEGTITIMAMPGPHNTTANKFYYLNAMTIKAH